ncbi:MAG TPA: hypothetical protein VFP88_04215 [Rhodanobacteraceae bacterium]|nr:hypothetical protein [Rhodanobacteraceae bacterium]
MLPDLKEAFADVTHLEDAPMKKSQLLLSMAMVGALTLLSACQTIRSHNPFRHHEADYKSAQQAQPLEVPPGLDNPPNSEALTIPPAGGPEVMVNGRVVGNAGSAPTTAVVTGNTLTLADDPASAYRRVGLALDRGGVGTVSSHDDNAMSYQVAVDSMVTTQEKEKGGFFHRLFHRNHSETRKVTGTVTVSVAPSGSGSVVNVQGNADAVQRVLGVLQQRLGGG